VGNILALIKRFGHVFLFLILQVVAFRFIVQSSNYKIARSIIGTQHSISGGLLQKKNQITEYLYLKETNDKLLAENTLLKKQLLQENKSIPIKDSTGTVISYNKDSVKKEFRYRYHPAKVVDITFDQKDNYITIDKGRYNGIKNGMAVLSEMGIAGQVINTGEHYSVVKSIISSRFRVSARLKDGTIGYINWPKQDSRFVKLNDISGSIKVAFGDTVYTSGYSLFPAGIIIGRIAKLELAENGNNYDVFLNTNFRKLHYVYVVEDISINEITTLQDSTIAREKAMMDPKRK
jgi:rod shape-determining protein MreC